MGKWAKRTGLTVRALHHYDPMGLLKPLARTGAGAQLALAARRADIEVIATGLLHARFHFLAVMLASSINSG